VKEVDDLQIQIESAARELILKKGMTKTITVEFDVCRDQLEDNDEAKHCHQLVAWLGKSVKYTSGLYGYIEVDGIGVFFDNELPVCFKGIRIQIKRKFFIKMLVANGEQ
jgi:hypothetical protein